MDDGAVTVLQERMADLCGHLNVLHAQLVDTVVEAVENDLWQQWGIRSPEHWLAWQTGLSPARAKQLVDTAKRASELPVTFAAFADGELSVDQVVTVAKYTPSHNDAEVSQLARFATVAQLRNSLSRYVHHVDAKPEMASAKEVVGDPRDLVSTGFDDDGRFFMHVNAPADHGAVIEQALREARDALFHAGQPDVTWLDALVEVCNRSLDTVTSASRRDRYRVYVHLDTDNDGGPAHAWLNGGPHLPASLRDLLCCDGVVQPLWHTAGSPINVGRSRYIVPPHTRRAILDRDHTCRHPGCNCKTYLEIHHIIEWLRDGATDLDNLAALCSKHHHAYHRGEFSMAGNANIPGQLRFYDARGRPVANSAAANPPTGPPPTSSKPYAHPTGEGFDTLWFNLTSA